MNQQKRIGLGLFLPLLIGVLACSMSNTVPVTIESRFETNLNPNDGGPNDGNPNDGNRGDFNPVNPIATSENADNTGGNNANPSNPTTPLGDSAEVLAVRFANYQNGATIYRDPSTDSAVIGQFNRANPIEVIRIEEEWLQTRSDVGIGWVLLSETEAIPPPNAPNAGTPGTPIRPTGPSGRGTPPPTRGGPPPNQSQ